MKIDWSYTALLDLKRLETFLTEGGVIDPSKRRSALIDAAESLSEFPYRGATVSGFGRNNIRRLVISEYEIRYAVTDDHIHILNVWHTREDRPL